MLVVSIYRRPGTATRPGAREPYREHGLTRAEARSIPRDLPRDFIRYRGDLLGAGLALLDIQVPPFGVLAARFDLRRTDALDTPRAAGIGLHHAELPQHPIATCMGTPLAGNRRTTLAPTFAGRSHRLLGT